MVKKWGGGGVEVVRFFREGGPEKMGGFYVDFFDAREGCWGWEGGMFGMEGRDAGDGKEGRWGWGVEVRRGVWVRSWVV